MGPTKYGYYYNKPRVHGRQCLMSQPLHIWGESYERVCIRLASQEANGPAWDVLSFGNSCPTCHSGGLSRSSSRENAARMDTASREQGSRVARAWTCSSWVRPLSFPKGQARLPQLMWWKVTHVGTRALNAHPLPPPNLPLCRLIFGSEGAWPGIVEPGLYDRYEYDVEG